MKVIIRFSALLSAFLILSSGMCSPDNPEPKPQPNPVTPTPSVVSVSSVSLNKTTLTLTEGESEVLNATVKPDDASDKTVTWTSSDTSIATVDGNGKVTAVKAGTATVSAKAGDKSATCTVTVNKKVVAVTSVTLNKTELTLTEGESETLTATVKPDDATDKTVTWSTSDASVAKVENGKVTAIKEGKASITAKAGEKSATCVITVIPDSMSGGHEGTGKEQWD